MIRYLLIAAALALASLDASAGPIRHWLASRRAQPAAPSCGACPCGCPCAIGQACTCGVCLCPACPGRGFADLPPVVPTAAPQVMPPARTAGHWEMRCNGQRCVPVWVPDPR